MNYLTKPRWVVMAGAVIAMTSTLLAVPVSVTSRAALTGNDTINWPGDEFDYLGAAFNTTTVGGLGVAVSGATESFEGYERADQSSSWDGNFARGDRLLWTGFGFAPQIMMFEFASPVFGAGAQIQNDFLFQGAFMALLTAYDSGGVVIHTDTFAGNSTSDADNSAIFIGVLNDVENIAKLELSVVGSESYAINQMSINRTRTSVPETGEYLTLMMVLSLFAMRLMFRERPVAA
jgi:hypothetical protein